jgi:nitrilase
MRSPNGGDRIRVAVVQHAPVFLNLERSLTKACELIEQAAAAGAKLIAFPETWLPGYPIWLDYAPNAALWDYAPAKTLYRQLAENSISIPGRHLERLMVVAENTGTYVVMGAHELSGSTLYNTMILIDKDGRSVQLHRKLMPTYTERLVWGRGDGSTLNVLDTEHGKLGGLICWEHWMPLARAAMHAKHETIHVAQWPSVRELHQLASRHYAFEGQCFVLAAGSVLTRAQMLEGYASLDPVGDQGLEILSAIPGADEDMVMTGGSAVIGPDAQYLAGPVFDTECILYSDIDLGRVTEGHLVLDTDGHYARPDVFQLLVNDRPQANVVFASQVEAVDDSKA